MSQTVGTRKPATELLPRVQFRHWGHSREEDTAEIEVYRPDGFDFPPSFGRDGFEMLVDGQFIQDDIGPADGVVQVTGSWTATGPQQIEVSFEQGERPGFSFQIVSVDDTSFGSGAGQASRPTARRTGWTRANSRRTEACRRRRRSASWTLTGPA